MGQIGVTTKIRKVAEPQRAPAITAPVKSPETVPVEVGAK